MVAAEVPSSPTKTGSVMKLFIAFLIFRPCDYDSLPDRYLPSILYGLGIIAICVISIVIRVLVMYGIPRYPVSFAKYLLVFAALRYGLMLLTALVFSGIASCLFGRSHTPQTYSLWIGTWTYIPVMIPLYLWSEKAADCFGFVLCVINACMLNSFANAKTPFGGWCGYILHFLYCYWALAFNCLVYVSD